MGCFAIRLQSSQEFCADIMGRCRFAETSLAKQKAFKTKGKMNDLCYYTVSTCVMSSVDALVSIQILPMQYPPVNVCTRRGEIKMPSMLYLQRGHSNIERPLLLLFLIRLHNITLLKVLPSFKAHTTLGTLSHLLNILLDVLERSNDT